MHTLRIGVVAIVLAVHSFASAKEPDAQTAKNVAAAADEKDTRLTMNDVQALRRQRVSPDQIADDIAERGRAFEVTADILRELRGLGFRPAQIDAIKDSSPAPLVPGKWLTTDDTRRERIFKELKLVAVKSKAAVEPVASQHVTLWAAKETQPSFLRDLRKLEKFFHTKCAEPIRSGLDKRSTHLVLLKDRAEYEAWWRVMFALFGERFDEKDSPGRNVHFREQTIKLPSYYAWDFCVIRLDGGIYDWSHHNAMGGVANMYFAQLANPRQAFSSPLQTGFINVAEAAVFASPSIMFSTVIYGERTRDPGGTGEDWRELVQKRNSAHRATPLAELLQMNSSKMLYPQYAEGWTLVELLMGQRGKFGKLLLTLRDDIPELDAVQKIYGWDEKKLTQEWRTSIPRRK